MLKRWVALVVFTGAAVFLCVHGWHVPLVFIVLFPVVLFPIFYYFHIEDKWLFLLLGFLAFILLIVGYFRFHSIQLVFVGVGVVVFLSALAGYRRRWRRIVREEQNQQTLALRELEELRGKYQTRLEGLHRLEKQVASLMELFETARDFSECLSFEMMTKVLREKMMPELPCTQMGFLLLSGTEPPAFARHFLISVDKVEEQKPEFSARDEKDLFEVVRSKKMMQRLSPVSTSQDAALRQEEKWLFPLMIEGNIAAILTVEGAHHEDLVRYEVLAAHLVLQVKKIQLYEKVKELSIIDGLTEVYVRRHFLERFKEEVQRSIKYHLPFSVLMLDIDNFKRYNDQFGHLVGDATLKGVASLLRESLRKVDIVARYGGEEFVAVLPETSGRAALEIAERIRSSIARHHFKIYDVKARVTVSLGIANYPEDIVKEHNEPYYPELEFDLIRSADKALYRAKEEGRNQVYCYQDL